MKEDDTTIDYNSLLWNVAMNDDQQAYQVLFERCYVPLCLYAKRFIDNKAIREDIVQDVFFAVWAKRKNLALPISAKGYLVTSVKNHCLNYLRKQDYHEAFLKEQYIRPQDDSGDLYSLRELYELLDKALEKLPEEYRLAFLLSRFEGKSTAEIAELMHVSVRTVERYRERAVEILRKELKDYLPFIIFLLC